MLSLASSAIIALIEDIAGIKGGSIKAESHVPENIELSIKLPGKKADVAFTKR